MRIGAQFFTLREQCKTLDGLREMLARVREIGYETVQISGTCAYDPQWLRDQLQEFGLRCVLTHTDPKRMAQEPEQVAREHDVFSCRYVGIGMIPGGLEGGEADYRRFVETYLPVAKAMQASGHLLMYHNHDMEFARSENGKLYLERMIEDFPADLLGFTFDTYWAQHGGGDSAAWLRRLAGRIPCVHFKDMVYSLEDRAVRMAPVGSGNLNFETCLTACQEGGTEFILVEQDDCYGRSPLDCLKESYDYLRSLGLR